MAFAVDNILNGMGDFRKKGGGLKTHPNGDDVRKYDNLMGFIIRAASFFWR